MKIILGAYWRRWLKRHGCKFGKGPASVCRGARIFLEPRVSVADVEIESKNLNIGHSTYIRDGGTLAQVDAIGRYCSIGKNVYIGLARDLHPIHWVTTHPVAEAGGMAKHHAVSANVSIGHDVWIGRDVLIMAGVKIGTGAVVAAGSVVVRDVSPYSIVGGNPARTIKQRFSDDLIERLLASGWWDIDYDALVSLPMNDPDHFLDLVKGVRSSRGEYARIEITRTSCRYVGL
ncbi:CatB-related O-acetyltransferase [Pseudomonas zhanjiangensis]|uniref:Chloramphenicol acetyltransferase n=1 Tax=Pseudomonas zhanjiangensis TaxID=3239015 RepID=A0ABV3YSA1_9PSED